MNTLGAHELLELHEVLSDAIHGLNTLKLYRPHARDGQLAAMVDAHMHALTMEYNDMVQMAHRMGGSQAVPVRRSASAAGMSAGFGGQRQGTFQPTYGLHQPQPQTPASGAEDIDDVDVAICLVNCHKQTASLKMKATLEMAHPMLRSMMQSAANASANMAYEAFQYANQRGFYQVPTMKDTTTETFMSAYGSAPSAQTNMQGQPYTM